MTPRGPGWGAAVAVVLACGIAGDEVALLQLARQGGPPPPVEVVVAAYREGLGFVEPMVARVPGAKARIYCAGPALQDPRCNRIPNYGCESYAYLRHIVDHYDGGLAPVTVFSMGSVLKSEWDCLLCKKLDYALAQLDSPEKQRNFSGFAAMGSGHAWRSPFEEGWDLVSYRAQSHAQVSLVGRGSGHGLIDAGGSCRPSVAPLGAWYKRFADGNLTRAKQVGTVMNSIFAVSRDRIRRYPKATYTKLLQEFERCGTDVPQVAGHYMERAWFPMFSDPAQPGVREKGRCPIRQMIQDYEAELVRRGVRPL